ncbi:MAG: hypothetical protein ACTSU5_07365 [Promethearchaeota archaeon]
MIEMEKTRGKAKRRSVVQMVRDALEFLRRHPEGVFKSNLNKVVSNDSVAKIVELFKIFQDGPLVEIRRVGSREILIPLFGVGKKSTGDEPSEPPTQGPDQPDPNDILATLYNLEPGPELERKLRELAYADSRFEKYLEAYEFDHRKFRRMIVADFSFST